jgi:hypothetical protein
VQLSVVYGRELDGEVTTFGTTGYTYKSTFLLYDRKTDSMWYPYKPGEMNAMSGPVAGKALPYLGTPERMSLADWRKKHSDSLVLIGDTPQE